MEKNNNSKQICPNCNLEMEAGILVGHGGYWRRLGGIISRFSGFGILGAVAVIAHKCNKCGKIELVAKS